MSFSQTLSDGLIYSESANKCVCLCAVKIVFPSANCFLPAYVLTNVFKNYFSHYYLMPQGIRQRMRSTDNFY